MVRPVRLLTFLLGAMALAQDSRPCEDLLAARQDRPAWSGLVVEVPSGDTLIVLMGAIGRRRIRLAGLRAPRDGEPLAAVSRFHLKRAAEGQRVFVVLEAPPAAWTQELSAVVEDFSEAQLAAGLARYQPEEGPLLGPYLACRCQRAESQARQERIGLWRQ